MTAVTNSHKTAAEWAASDEILGQNQVGWADDTAEHKYGDGVHTWAQLGIPQTSTPSGQQFVTQDQLGSSTFTVEMAQDAFAALIAAGTITGMTIVYDDAGNAISFFVPPGYTDEQAQDAVAAIFNAGTDSGITFTYDDAGNRVGATVNFPTMYTDEQAQDAIASLFASGTLTGITAVYDDAGNKMSFTALAPTTIDGGTP